MMRRVGLVVFVLCVAVGWAGQRTERVLAATYGPGWQLVAGPTGAKLSGASGSIYSLLTDGSYRTEPASNILLGGFGYWAYFPSGGSLVIDDVARSLSRSWSLVTWAQTWTTVGNPSATDTSLVIGAETLLVYSPEAGYTATDRLQPGQGAFAIASGSGAVLQYTGAQPPRALGCSQENATAAQQSIGPIRREFDDGVQVAENTPRISLAPQITQLQAVERRIEAATVPSCAATVRSDNQSYMREELQFMVAFLGRTDDALLALQIKLVTTFKDLADRENAALDFRAHGGQ